MIRQILRKNFVFGAYFEAFRDLSVGVETQSKTARARCAVVDVVVVSTKQRGGDAGVEKRSGEPYAIALIPVTA